MQGYVTFELGLSEGEVKNVRTQSGTSAVDDAFTWQVSCSDGAVTIFGMDGRSFTILGTATIDDRGVLSARVGKSVDFPNAYQWQLVAQGLSKVLTTPITVDGEPSGMTRLARARSGSTGPSTPMGWRHVVAIAVFVAGFGTLLVLTLKKTFSTGFPLHSWHVVVAPLAGLLSPLMVAGSVAILSSEEALAEPQATGSDGKETPGPIATTGFVLLLSGLILYIYPLIMILDGTVGQQRPRFELPATAPAPTEIVTTPITRPPPPTPKPAPAPPPPLEVQVATAPSLAAAISLAKPQLGDGADNAGAWLLARYASAKLVWSDAHVAEPETSFGLVLKDSDLERGKRMCATGKLLDIERKDLDKRPVYIGELETADGDRARFIAVGSTGLLVKRSTGTLCGVVTGKHAKAVMLVGQFDLPENQQPAVER